MLLNCGVGEDSWESLGLQGDPTSPFWRRSALGFLWKEWCWSWNSSNLATSWEELTHWKRLWCWEGLEAGGEEDNRGWDGWMVSPTRWTWVWVDSESWWWTGRPGVLWFMGFQSRTRLSDWTELNLIFSLPDRKCSLRSEMTKRCPFNQPMDVFFWPRVSMPKFRFLAFPEMLKVLPIKQHLTEFRFVAIPSRCRTHSPLLHRLLRLTDCRVLSWQLSCLFFYLVYLVICVTCPVCIWVCGTYDAEEVTMKPFSYHQHMAIS